MTDVYIGSSSISVFVEIADLSGQPKTGLIHSDITGSYARNRTARTAITMATLALITTAWTSGGFKEVDATNQPGLYRVDVPNAAFATGATEVVLTLLASGCRATHRGFRLKNGSDDSDNGLAAMGSNYATDGYIQANIAAINDDSDALARLWLYWGVFAKNGQATGGAASTIILALGSGTVLNEFKGWRISITAGASAGDVRTILSNTTSRICTVDRAWTTPTDNTSAYLLEPPAAVNLAVVRSETLNALVAGRMDSHAGAMAANVITTAAINDGAFTAAKFTSVFPTNFASMGINASGHVTRVTLADTATTLTNDPTGLTTLLSRVTSARAGYLDNINLGGLVASGSQVTALYNMSRVSLDAPPQILIPTSGTTTFVVTARLYDADSGNMAAPDSTPTLTATLGDGTDVSARLSAATNPSTGLYRWTYTSSSAHGVNQQVRFDVAFVEDGNPTSQGVSAYTVAAITADFTPSDRTMLGNIPTNTLLANDSRLNYLDESIASRLPTSGYTAPPTANTIATAVWASGTRTLSSFGTLVADMATAVWSAVSRTITGSNKDAAIDAARAAAESADGKLDDLDDTLSGIEDELIDIANDVAAIGSGPGNGLTQDQSDKLDRLVVTPAGSVVLSSYPPSLQLAVPQPGVGAFAPGARNELGTGAFRLTHYAGSTLVLLARVVDADGAYLDQAATASISSTATNQQNTADTTTASHVVASSVYDSLQADARWSEDGLGYNLALSITGTRIAAAGTTYRITVTLTDSQSRPIVIRYDVQTI